MTPERALLRRLVEWTEHPNLFDTERPLREFARDARALLAEPEGHSPNCGFIVDGESSPCDCDYKPPRSRAEAEAMLKELSDAEWSYEHTVGDDFTRASQRRDAARAALLAALTGEGE